MNLLLWDRYYGKYYSKDLLYSYLHRHFKNIILDFGKKPGHIRYRP